MDWGCKIKWRDFTQIYDFSYTALHSSCERYCAAPLKLHKAVCSVTTLSGNVILPITVNVILLFVLGTIKNSIIFLIM